MFLWTGKERLEWAGRFIAEHVRPKMPVVVHLKNNPREKGCSNADQEAWCDFFMRCAKDYDVLFILIGNEEISDRLKKLPNVLVARDQGSTLSSELALIEQAAIFMGMASGPCNMAIFNDVPYVIYKNPDHHVREMKEEMGDSDRFSFSKPFQKLLRKKETPDGLMEEFRPLFEHVKQSKFEKVRI